MHHIHFTSLENVLSEKLQDKRTSELLVKRRKNWVYLSGFLKQEQESEKVHFFQPIKGCKQSGFQFLQCEP